MKDCEWFCQFYPMELVIESVVDHSWLCDRVSEKHTFGMRIFYASAGITRRLQLVKKHDPLMNIVPVVKIDHSGLSSCQTIWC
jgi:hypothetical protein